MKSKRIFVIMGLLINASSPVSVPQEIIDNTLYFYVTAILSLQSLIKHYLRYLRLDTKTGIKYKPKPNLI